MVYRLCSRRRVLATTDLGFTYRENSFRCGWLTPTDLGERLLPRATEVAPALRAEWAIGPDATAHADVLAAVDHEEALELELHREDGSIVPTADIAIIDTEYLLSLPDVPVDSDEVPELSEEDEVEVAEILEEFNHADALVGAERCEETEWPRYQLQVRLLYDQDIP